MPKVPIGTILPWVLKLEGGQTVNIPDGWMRCDGSTVLNHNGSIWAGLILPNLNGERRFLRGGSDEDVLKLEDDQMQDHKHIFHDPGHSHIYWATKTYTGCRDNACDDDTYQPQEYEKKSESSSTGASVDYVMTDYRSGSETRPKNMNVIYIIRVW